MTDARRPTSSRPYSDCSHVIGGDHSDDSACWGGSAFFADVLIAAEERPIMPAVEWMQQDCAKADATVVRRAVVFLRTGLHLDGCLDLLDATDIAAMAAVLDFVAAEIAYLDPVVRWQAVESCKKLLGVHAQP